MDTRRSVHCIMPVHGSCPFAVVVDFEEGTQEVHHFPTEYAARAFATWVKRSSHRIVEATVKRTSEVANRNKEWAENAHSFSDN